MAWNEPGNNGKDRDPWGNSGKNQTPPDLDRVFRNFLQKLSALVGGGVLPVVCMYRLILVV